MSTISYRGPAIIDSIGWRILRKEMIIAVIFSETINSYQDQCRFIRVGGLVPYIFKPLVLVSDFAFGGTSTRQKFRLLSISGADTYM